MRIEFHRLVLSDIARIMDYYKDAAGLNSRTSSMKNFARSFKKAADAPHSYAVRERDLRRVNLGRFPYHFLYRVVGDALRVLVVRHHNRRPSLGVHRR